MSDKERFSKYWLCDECAEKQGLVYFKEVSTKTMGLCGHCDNPTEIILTPVVDFKKKAKDERAK